MNENLKKVRIGELLVQSGLVSDEQLQEALDYQKTPDGTGMKIGTILIKRGYVSEDDFIETLHKRLDIPIVDLTHYRIHINVTNVLSHSVALKYGVLPLQFDDTTIVVAMQNPMDYYAIEEIELVTKHKVRPVLAKEKHILEGIEKTYSGGISHEVISSANREFDKQIGQIDEESLRRVNSAPIVQLVDAILNQADKMRASDIHIESSQTNVRIRFRVDGELLEIMELNLSVQSSLITRLKIMSDMDIAEKRMPQDGRFQVTVGGRELFARVASMPTVNGEKVVIRLLGDSTGKVMPIDMLGMTERDEALFMRILNIPAGIVLVAGPTGSGKTTTLYSALQYISKPNVNIVSIEDPVEKSIGGVNQMQINVKAGITFASGLRSMMRQDPDIIMVGEIRDDETAEIASRAAITGHMVLSTIHTNDSISTFSRIISMGVEPYIASSAIMGVISQRLVRVLCSKCKREVEVTEEMRNLVPELEPLEKVFEPVGCAHCNSTGYFGRTAVYEILVVNNQMRTLIARGALVEEIYEATKTMDFHTLRQNVLDVVREGRTSIAELVKITFSLD